MELLDLLLYGITPGQKLLLFTNKTLLFGLEFGKFVLALFEFL